LSAIIAINPAYVPGFLRVQSHTNVIQFRRWRGAESSRLSDRERASGTSTFAGSHVGTCNSFVRPFEAQSARSSCRVSTIEAYRTLNHRGFARIPPWKKKKKKTPRSAIKIITTKSADRKVRWSSIPSFRVALNVHILTRSAIIRDNRWSFQRSEQDRIIIFARINISTIAHHRLIVRRVKLSGHLIEHCPSFCDKTCDFSWDFVGIYEERIFVSLKVSIEILSWLFRHDKIKCNRSRKL